MRKTKPKEQKQAAPDLSNVVWLVYCETFEDFVTKAYTSSDPVRQPQQPSVYFVLRPPSGLWVKA